MHRIFVPLIITTHNLFQIFEEVNWDGSIYVFLQMNNSLKHFLSVDCFNGSRDYGASGGKRHGLEPHSFLQLQCVH